MDIFTIVHEFLNERKGQDIQSKEEKLSKRKQNGRGGGNLGKWGGRGFSVVPSDWQQFFDLFWTESSKSQLISSFNPFIKSSL